MSAWIVAMEDKLAEEKMNVITVEGKKILLIRKEGTVYAIDNKCPHMGCPLKGGILDGYVLKCSCHNWGFDIRTGMNAKTGAYVDKPDAKVSTYQTKISDGNISVML